MHNKFVRMSSLLVCNISPKNSFNMQHDISFVLTNSLKTENHVFDSFPFCQDQGQDKGYGWGSSNRNFKRTWHQTSRSPVLQGKKEFYLPLSNTGKSLSKIHNVQQILSLCQSVFMTKFPPTNCWNINENCLPIPYFFSVKVSKKIEKK